MRWTQRAGLTCALLCVAGLCLWLFLASDRRIEERQHARLNALPDAPLTPFASDGCSGGLSTVWTALAEDLPFEACCITHDRVYHAGGAETTARAGYDARLRADIALQACVAETGGQVIADAMYQAVRLGGQPCSGLSWRWGYGRAGCP